MIFGAKIEIYFVWKIALKRSMNGTWIMNNFLLRNYLTRIWVEIKELASSPAGKTNACGSLFSNILDSAARCSHWPLTPLTQEACRNRINVIQTRAAIILTFHSTTKEDFLDAKALTFISKPDFASTVAAAAPQNKSLLRHAHHTSKVPNNRVVRKKRDWGEN